MQLQGNTPISGTVSLHSLDTSWAWKDVEIKGAEIYDDDESNPPWQNTWAQGQIYEPQCHYQLHPCCVYQIYVPNAYCLNLDTTFVYEVTPKLSNCLLECQIYEPQCHYQLHPVLYCMCVYICVCVITEALKGIRSPVSSLQHYIQVPDMYPTLIV